MTFQEKNAAVSLASFILVMIVLLSGIFNMVQGDGLTESGVFRLWIITIILAIIFTIAATILTHIVTAIIEVIRTGNEDPEIDDTADERDKLIDLRGTKVAFSLSSIGIFLAMLTYVLGQPALVMFTLLIFVGVAAQIAGDVSRLILYRRGF